MFIFFLAIEEKGVMDNLLESLKKGGIPRLHRDNSRDSLVESQSSDTARLVKKRERLAKRENSIGDLEARAAQLLDRIGAM